MIEITDRQDGARKLRRSYEDYIPLETQPTEQAEQTAEPTTEPTETTEPAELAAEPTSEPNEA